MIPKHTYGGFMRYIQHRLKPCSFCLHMLEGNLDVAIQHADMINKEHIQGIVDWLNNPENINPEIWRSPENVKRWVDGWEPPVTVADRNRLVAVNHEKDVKDLPQ